MKIATICHTHQHMSGGIKWQLYTAQEFIKAGHECHFYLKDLTKPNWFPENINFHYHLFDEIYDKDHSGDLLIGNWFHVANVLNDDEIKSRWKKRLLVVHDVPTASNYKNCLDGDFKISCVSFTLYNILTSLRLRRELNRVLPGTPHCGFNPKIFNNEGRSESKKIRIVAFDRLSPDENDDGFDVRGMIYVNKIKEQILNNFPDVEFRLIKTNSEEETANEFKNSDCYLDCSILAGMPTPLVESMACGCIPIITSQGSTNIVLDGFNGIIIPKGNVDYSIYKIKYALNGLLSKMKNRSSMENHNWENQSRLFLFNLQFWDDRP